MNGRLHKTNPVGWLLAAIFVAGAFLEIGRMLRYLFRSVTNVLWVDQWIMLEELWRFRDGRYTLAYLWTPYWGHRIPVPRLVFLLDERLFHFSNVPLVIVNIGMQACSVAILSVIQWKLLSTKSRPLAVGMIAVTSYLLFSGLQMENFVYGMSVQYAIGYVSAIAALACGVRENRRAFGVAVALALISTLTIAAGLLLWPLLALKVFLLQRSRRRFFTLLGLGAALAATYGIGYSQPGNGMGVSGMLHHPLQAIAIASMFLGGPLSLASIFWGQVAGAMGMALSAYLLWRCFRGTQRQPEPVILLTLALWLVGISFSIPLARMRPEWIASFHGAAPLPSRYFTPAFLFWICLTAAILWGSTVRIVTAVSLVATTAVTVCALTRESAYLSDWLTFCQTLDAAASGFLIGAGDPEYMARSYPDQKLLDRWMPYAKQHRLSVFAEPRATWTSQNVKRLVSVQDDLPCHLTLDSPTQAGIATRISGAVEGSFGLLSAQRDLILTNSTGSVIGLGRTFVDTSQGERRHRFLAYVPGLPDEVISIYFIADGGTGRRCITASSSAEHTDRSGNRNVPH